MKKLFILILLFSCINGIAQSGTNYQRDSVALSDTFQTRVRVATISAAKDILAATGQAEYLLKYCELIISAPEGKNGWLEAMSYGVASTPAITLDCTDSDIQFTVNANIDKYAKAYFQITESSLFNGLRNN